MSDQTHAPGASIQNRAGGGAGSLGCFAKKDGKPVLLSCAHVLFADLPEHTDEKIYLEYRSSCCKGDPIATTLNRWEDGFHYAQVKVAADAEPWEGFETDCAIALLRPGVKFTNEIPGIGMIKGVPPAGNLGVQVGPPFGTDPGPEHYVRFYSQQTRSVHYGTLLKSPSTGTYLKGGAGVVPPPLWPFPASDPSDVLANAKPNINQLIVLPRPAPGKDTLQERYKPYLEAKQKLYFSRHGDSGSVVVNHQGQVIGVIARGDGGMPPSAETAMEWKAAAGIGIVNPIHKVLDQMQIEIPAGFSGAAPSSGTTYFVMPGDPLGEATRRGMERTARQVAATRLGRLVLEKGERHRREVRRIVLGVRHALVTWHRLQGPAFAEHFARALRDPAHVIPTAINGVERARMLAGMADVLERHGSPALQRDVRRYRALALAHAPRVATLDEVPDVLEQARRERLAAARRAA